MNTEPVKSTDFGDLLIYLEQLSPQTKARFAPHKFDLPSLMYLHEATEDHLGFLLKDKGKIIGYSIVKHGYLDHDFDRLSQYGLELSSKTDCTFAPSLADDHQGKGLGQKMFDDIQSTLSLKGFERVILWGGVQASNYRAVRYYQKLGFRVLGQFEYNGTNFDMVLDL